MGRDHIFKIKKNAKKIQDFSVIIPAAGLGTRVGGESKPLLKIGNEYLIQRQIRILKERYGQNLEIIAVLGYKNPEIISVLKNSCNIIINERFNTTNVVYSIYLGLLASMKKSSMLLYGDLVFDYDALPEINEDSLLLTDDKQMKKDEIGVLLQGTNIVNLIYDTNTKWCQIGFLTEEYLKNLFDYCKLAIKHKHFGYEALNYCISELKPIKSVPCQGKIVEIDTFKDLENAQKIFKGNR